MHLKNKPRYADSNGEWSRTTEEEILMLLGLHIYMGIVRLPRYSLYWSTDWFFHGLWARLFMTEPRFWALMGMLHISNPTTENRSNKLTKLEPLFNHIQSTCKRLYQCGKNVAIDERMVKSKNRTTLRQYMPDKPTKFGFKLFVLSDSSTGYTLDFFLYEGKNTRFENDKGLGYNTVTKLANSLGGSGYHIFVDNFYTSAKLMADMYYKGFLMTGTLRQNRLPPALKNFKRWARCSQRGQSRSTPDEDHPIIQYTQWVDKKVVSVATTAPPAFSSETETCLRREKIDGVWKKIKLSRPTVISNYNKVKYSITKF